MSALSGELDSVWARTLHGLVEEVRSAVREELAVARAGVARQSAGCAEYLTRKDVGAITGYSPSLIAKAIRSGELKEVGEGRRRRISRADLTAFMGAQAKAAPALDVEARAAAILERKRHG